MVDDRGRLVQGNGDKLGNRGSRRRIHMGYSNKQDDDFQCRQVNQRCDDTMRRVIAADNARRRLNSNIERPKRIPVEPSRKP
jgi:hypothetical protein